MIREIIDKNYDILKKRLYFDNRIIFSFYNKSIKTLTNKNIKKMDSEIEKKQSFLFREIIEKDY